jgi:hypothetical protein
MLFAGFVFDDAGGWSEPLLRAALQRHATPWQHHHLGVSALGSIRQPLVEAWALDRHIDVQTYTYTCARLIMFCSNLDTLECKMDDS